LLSDLSLALLSDGTAKRPWIVLRALGKSFAFEHRAKRLEGGDYNVTRNPVRLAESASRRLKNCLPNFRAPDMGVGIYATSEASYVKVSVVPGY